jgi:hypothetical protein
MWRIYSNPDPHGVQETERFVKMFLESSVPNSKDVSMIRLETVGLSVNVPAEKPAEQKPVDQ